MNKKIIVIFFIFCFVYFFSIITYANEINNVVNFITVNKGVNLIKTTILPDSFISEKNGNLEILKKIDESLLSKDIEFAIGQQRSVNSEDYKWLCQIVQAEAGNQDLIGKILVVNVILNRVERNHSSIKSVIFAPRQFQPVANGTIYSVSPSEETINAVQSALNGIDYSDGALYFMNRAGSKSNNITWFDRSLTFLFKHGDHEFFK